MTEVNFSRYIPSWLNSLFEEKFFDACLNDEKCSQKERNIFCLKCCISFCTNCASSHVKHKTLQIRKYNFDRVVKVEEMNKLVDCSLVQSYMLNRSMVVFLKERAPLKKKEKEACCASCDRVIRNECNYCSITCLVKHMVRTEGNIIRHLREFPLEFLPPSTSSNNCVSVDKELNSSGSSQTDVEETEVKKRKNVDEIPNSGSFRRRRRKGTPIQAPFY